MLLGETFEYTDSDGTLMDRGQWLAHVKKGADEDEQLGNSGLTAHLYGNAAVVTGKYQEKINVGGKAILRSGRFTDTWIRENAEWKCVASQLTLMPTPR